MGSTTIVLLVTLVTMTVMTISASGQYYQYNNEILKPHKQTYLNKKLYYHKNLYKNAPPLAYHRNAVYWGQRWQQRRPQAAVPIVPRVVKPVIIPPSFYRRQLPSLYNRAQETRTSSASVPVPFGGVRDQSRNASRDQAQAIDWSAADMMQRPIDDAPRKTDRSLGDPCSYSRDCSSGCCLLDRASKSRSCQPMALFAEKCSIGQVKGDLYTDACPCASGTDHCSSSAGVCAA
ncbi:hypothetical protein HDE_13222 [Halotydeus destructor]|nr:hypothetical protein HDE_13222 [Halotydeus destructor]